MPLEDAIQEVRERLAQNRYPNEQAISYGIVMRFLQQLDWDTYDTSLVWPEYGTVDGRRVDFALCHPPSKPAVFIEVKRPGDAENHVEQALRYAFDSGAPMVVLTDGGTWSFYLPAEQGTYEDRRVYKLDLEEREVAEAADALRRYLSAKRVASGAALETARKEYRSRAKREQAKAALPEAWEELKRRSEALHTLLADAVENKVGVRPESADVAAFLRVSPLPKTPAQPMKTAAAARPQRVREEKPAAPKAASTPAASRAGELVVLGNRMSYRNATEALVKIINRLEEEQPGLLQRASTLKTIRTKKRRYLAQSADDLYDNPDLRDAHKPLRGGWVLATNANNITKMKILRAIVSEAGLTFGKDVQIDF